ERLAQQQRFAAGDGEIDRRERARPPARADERRAAAVNNVDRAPRYSAAITRSSICDGRSPCDDSVQIDATNSPRSAFPGLTRQSILFAKEFLRKGWTRGSSPRVMEGLRSVGPSSGPSLSLALHSAASAPSPALADER